MPNLTSYHAPPIHLNRELPKTYCDLIQHEIDYIHFLRTRIANIQSSLSFTNKKHLTYRKNIPQCRHFDPNQHNLQLYKKIFQIWTNYDKQKGGVDCHNENYKKQINISHFHLRQKQWKDKIENENKRFICSLIYHRQKYRPIHDRYAAHEDFEHHLKLLKIMSHYPKYNLTHPVCKNLLTYDYLPKHIQFNKHKSPTNKPIKHKRIKSDKNLRRSTTYIQNILQQTMNDAIYIYNQPLSSASSRVKLSYSQDGQWSKPHLYEQQELFRSVS